VEGKKKEKVPRN